MSDYHINIFYSKEDGGYIADIPDLDSCSAFGETPEQALKELEIAKKVGWKQPARQEKLSRRRATGLQSTRPHADLFKNCPEGKRGKGSRVFC